MNVKAELNGVFGMRVQGTLFPPDLQTFVYVRMGGNSSIVFDMDANIQGALSFAPPPFLTIPLTPFTIVGLVNVGPEINLRAEANLGIQVFGSVQAGTSFQMPTREYMVRLNNKGENKDDEMPDAATDLITDVQNIFDADAAMQGQIT